MAPSKHKGTILHSIGGGERPSDEELDAFLLDALTGAGLLECKGELRRNPIVHRFYDVSGVELKGGE